MAPAGQTILGTTDGGHTWQRGFTVAPMMGGQLGCTGPSLAGSSGAAQGTAGKTVPSSVWALVVAGVGMNQETYGLFRSGDAGKHWQAVTGVTTAGAGPAPGNAAHAPSGPVGYAAQLAVVDAATAYLAGGCPPCGGVGTMQVGGTTDGGKTWRTYPPIPGVGFGGEFGLSFATVKQGWLALSTPNEQGTARTGEVLATTDGGKTWSRQYPPAPAAQACTTDDLTGSASWQGATGSLAGSLTLFNVGDATCVLPGQIHAELVDGNGQTLAVDTVAAPAGTAPSAGVALPPAWRGSVGLVWRNWCHGSVRGPIAVRLALGTGAAHQVTVVVTGPDGQPPAGMPRCDAPGARSTLSAGAPRVDDPTAATELMDTTASPIDVLASYYNAVNRREYSRAYGYLEAQGRPAFATFADGYADTGVAHITRLLVANGQQAGNAHAITCVGIALVASSKEGSETGYGGWYQVTSTRGQNPYFAGWRIVLPGSQISVGAPATLPPASACNGV
jgi:hypothetical protein